MAIYYSRVNIPIFVYSTEGPLMLIYRINFKLLRPGVLEENADIRQEDRQMDNEIIL